MLLIALIKFETYDVNYRDINFIVKTLAAKIRVFRKFNIFGNSFTGKDKNGVRMRCRFFIPNPETAPGGGSYRSRAGSFRREIFTVVTTP